VKLTLLGTGSPVPSRRRSSSGYLLQVGADVLIVDHGTGAFSRLMETGVQATDVTHVFLSHLHFDHCADFIRLFLHRWDLGGGLIPPLTVLGPPGLTTFMDRLFGPEGAFAPDLTARTSHPQSLRIFHNRGGTGARPWPEATLEEMDRNGSFTGNGWHLSVAEVPHHQPFLPNYGVRIQSDEGIFAYSSDVSGLDAGAPEPLFRLAHKADVLVHYLNTFTFDGEDGVSKTKQQTVAELARDAAVRTLVTTHHGPAMDRDGVRERVLADMRAIFRGTVVWGEDLMEFQIGNG
jgi:ribonuclease Z